VTSERVCLNVVQLKSHLISNVNCSDMFGNTALHLAAMNSRKQIVIILLQSGIDATLHNARSTTSTFSNLSLLLLSLFLRVFLHWTVKWNGRVS